MPGLNARAVAGVLCVLAAFCGFLVFTASSSPAHGILISTRDLPRRTSSNSVPVPRCSAVAAANPVYPDAIETALCKGTGGGHAKRDVGSMGPIRHPP